ncbi:MAG: hypothetical protein COB53_08670 [Elusimicrobia bacterium]|nr:MAG: hypothetical protein COB53_08670 [Elusimicrobiota bacterium]
MIDTVDANQVSFPLINTAEISIGDFKNFAQKLCPKDLDGGFMHGETALQGCSALEYFIRPWSYTDGSLGHIALQPLING